MAPPPNPAPDMQYLLSDLNTRIRDAEERNKITKERTLLIGKNLIDTKQEVSEELKEIRHQNQLIQAELVKLRKTTEALVMETGKYIKREEILLIERMLKDFQPLEFVRMKDLQEVLEQKTTKKHPKK
jgi:hypothetical protein